jgi:arylsulfatase A-like enzyme
LGKGSQEEHDYLYWEFHQSNGRVAVRKGDWKAVRYFVVLDPDSPLELYNLEEDPYETTNVATEYPELVAELDHLIRTSRTESPIGAFNFPRSNRPQDNPKRFRNRGGQ